MALAVSKESKSAAQKARTRVNKINSIKRELKKNPNNTLAKQRLEQLEAQTG